MYRLFIRTERRTTYEYYSGRVIVGMYVPLSYSLRYDPSELLIGIL